MMAPDDLDGVGVRSKEEKIFTGSKTRSCGVLSMIAHATAFLLPNVCATISCNEGTTGNALVNSFDCGI